MSDLSSVTEDFGAIVGRSYRVDSSYEKGGGERETDRQTDTDRGRERDGQTGV